MNPKTRHACKEFPNFKGFKFDQGQQQGSNTQQQKEHQAQEPQRTATLGKYSSLGRRPLPQTPDEKARKTPINPNNFRSLQRGAWQESVSTFQPNLQFRSLQRGNLGSSGGHAQFRPAKIQDQNQQSEAMYANNDSERQLYAVTEL
ncbi:hypothetical protein GWI33_013550 [Rhynchophorus ferrugineus]|uniref:Uncharacterized protein n=1 Tax=Rhynchophorus ferrugineus TaxID=354439 RepID=A0A834I3I6_RHYFE|nr:hypothetical protein GWI33_013550 [Rhynchophorus ferrugineus]